MCSKARQNPYALWLEGHENHAAWWLCMDLLTWMMYDQVLASVLSWAARSQLRHVCWACIHSLWELDTSSAEGNLQCMLATG